MNTTTDQSNLTEELTAGEITVGGLKIHYNEAGSGTPLVCIHGGGPASSGWRHFGHLLPELSAGFRTILIDLPGAGQSGDLPDEANTFAWSSELLDKVFDALGIDSAHVVGWSFGGRVTLKFAAAFPQRVRKTIVIGTAAELDGFAPRPSTGAKTVMAVMPPTGRTPENVTAFINAVVHDSSCVPEAEWSELVSDWQAASAAERPFNPGVLRDPQLDLYADLPKVTAPTLFVWGRDDVMGTFQAAALMLQRMPNAELHVFSKCGHWVQWEKRDEFVSVATEFLNR
jgi:4,5:9,10-diseco-3-hydroxy-5,9,17-trioxoandrosta-1(10),2-diene-4-oate hydrolase